jgi:hypothetical protein
MQVVHRAALLVGLRAGRLCPVARIDEGRTSLAYRSAQMGIDGSADHQKHSSFFHIHPARAQSSSEIEGRRICRGFGVLRKCGGNCQLSQPAKIVLSAESRNGAPRYRAFLRKHFYLEK